MAHRRRRLRIATVVAVLWVGGSAGLAAGQSESGKAPDPPAAPTESSPKPDAPPAKPVTEEITVTATRFERLIDLTPQSVTVLDSKEIHSLPMGNVQSMLGDAPGVSIQRAGGLDGQLVVRGLSSNDSRIVLFIDGDRFRGRNFLEYSLLDPNEIERVEIIRGPAAALYGSDAMNGVVNVITRRARLADGDVHQGFTLKPRLAALGFSSANKLGAARVELEGLGRGFDLLIGANYRTAGDYESPEGKIPNSDFVTRSLNARIGYSPGATRRFEMIAKVFSTDAGRANAPGAPLVITRQDPLKERYLRFAFSQDQIADRLQNVEASLYARNLSSILRSETRTAANGDVEFRNTWVKGPLELGGKLLARSIFANSVLAYGVDVYREDAPSFEDDVHTFDRSGRAIFSDPRSKRVRDAKQADVGALAHYDWDPSNLWTVSLGTRYDYVRTEIDAKPAPGEDPALTAAFSRNRLAEDGAATGSAGLIFRPLEWLNLVGNVSTAFRSPTTGDKSGSGQVGALITLPNADLKPETSVSYEGGLRLRWPSLNVNLTAYRTDYKDLLQFRFLNATTRERINLGRARVSGFELDGTYQMTPAWTWRGNAATARGTNTRTGAPLANVPPLNGLVGLRRAWPTGGFWIEGTGRWSRDKTRIDRSQERPTDGYTVWSLYGGADLGRLWPRLSAYRITVGIDNLTDKTYVSPVTRELVGFPRSATNPLVEPGRSLTVNLTAGF